MKTTVQAVYDQARSLLGDDQITGGEVFTNTALQPHFQKAYRSLYRIMASLGNPYIERDAFYTLAANTTYLDPATAGITDLAEPLFVEWRSGFFVASITNAVVGSGFVTITAPAHGCVSGDQVVIGGIGGLVGTDGIWGITVSDANTFTLNGCIATGAYTSGGTATRGGGQFQRMNAVDRFDDLASGNVGKYEYTWLQDVFGFRPSTVSLELRISYLASGNPPTGTSTTIGIDDSLDFLSTYSAGLAIASKGGQDRANELLIEALGPRKTEQNPDGMLLALLQAGIKRLQRIPPEQRRRQPFRRRITNSTTLYY